MMMLMMMLMMIMILTYSVVCLISKISMNVTLVTTPVQQNKCVSISRVAIHAWTRYSVPHLTSKSLKSECLRWWCCCVPPDAAPDSLSLSLSASAVSACAQLRTLPAGTNPSLFSTDTWTCRRGAVCLQTSSRCRPPRATPAPSTSSRSSRATRAESFTWGWVSGKSVSGSKALCHHSCFGSRGKKYCVKFGWFVIFISVKKYDIGQYQSPNIIGR